MANPTSTYRVKSQFQPILMKGHERSITTVKYNLDGDYIFTASKDQKPALWSAETGIRIGTYAHHGGAVWDIDPSWDSKYVLTACADSCSRLFELDGTYICKTEHKGAVRAVKWGDDNVLFADASDPFHSRDFGRICFYKVPESSSELHEPEQIVKNDPGRVLKPTRHIQVTDGDKAVSLGFTIGNEFLMVGMDSGNIVKYDVEYGTEVMRKKLHNDRVTRIRFNREKYMFATASKDYTALLVDPTNLEVVNTFTTDRPINGVAISPRQPHLILGGGQDAQNVTTTSASQGKFESRFFHYVYGEEFARVRGHFGPINDLDIHPFGRSYVSGSEDGYCRLHHFDVNYLSMPDMIPNDLK